MNINYSLLFEVRRWMSTPSTRSDIDIKLRVDPMDGVVDTIIIKKPLVGLTATDFDVMVDLIKAIPEYPVEGYITSLTVSEVHLTSSAGYHEITVECLICRNPILQPMAE